MAESEKQKGKEQGLKNFGILYISGAIDGGMAESGGASALEAAGLPPGSVRPHAGLSGGGARSHHSDTRSGDLALPRFHDLVICPR